MINFTERELVLIKNDLEEKLHMYETDKSYKEYYDKYCDSTENTINNAKNLIENIHKVNADKELNKLVEDVYWILDFHVWTLMLWNAEDLEEQGMLEGLQLELYKKFYEEKLIDGRWRICYKG